jgi:16S rRNA pseudouridine516 synthase
VKDAIWAGEITVGGSVVKDISFQFNANTKTVEWNGEALRLPGLHHTFVLNKPTDVICSRLNKQERALGKHSVFSVIREMVNDSVFDRLLTVGRLDEQTTGLLLLTTDGHLVHDITSPDKHVSKTYAVELDRELQPGDMELLSKGVTIELEVDGVSTSFTTSPADVSVDEDGLVFLSISEGRKRQVRRMFASLDYTVERLHRVSIGGLNLQTLGVKIGEAVEIEETLLRQLVFEP